MDVDGGDIVLALEASCLSERFTKCCRAFSSNWSAVFLCSSSAYPYALETRSNVDFPVGFLEINHSQQKMVWL
jgi:hypothetical protein